MQLKGQHHITPLRPAVVAALQQFADLQKRFARRKTSFAVSTVSVIPSSAH